MIMDKSALEKRPSPTVEGSFLAFFQKKFKVQDSRE